MKAKAYTPGRWSRLGLSVATVSLAGLVGVTARAADLGQGEELFKEHCAACHTTIESVRDKSGPNLHSVAGRRAGIEDYSGGYSEEMVASGVTWEVATLQAFINSPALMVRGTKMVFRGLPDAQERVDLACYLEQVAGNDVARNELCAETP